MNATNLKENSYERMSKLHAIFRAYSIDVDVAPYGNCHAEVQLDKSHFVHFGIIEDLRQNNFRIDAIGFKSNILIISLGASA